MIGAPGRRRVEVVALGAQPPQQAALGGPAEQRLGPFRLVRVVPGVGGAHGRRLTGRVESFGRVLAQRLQHVEARTVTVVGDDQGPVGERCAKVS